MENTDNIVPLSAKEPLRVVILTNIAPHYRLANWQALASHVAELRILLCATAEPNRIWEDAKSSEADSFQLHVLPGRHFHMPKAEIFIHWNPSIIRRLRRDRPSHLIVMGFDSPTYWLAMITGRLIGARVTMWWESHQKSSRRHHFVARKIRSLALSLSHNVVTAGTLATEYVASLGKRRDRIITSINAIDTADWWRLAAAARTSAQTRELDRIQILYVGQFIERKGVFDLLNAFAQLNDSRTHLTLVGYGPEEDRIRQFIADHAIHRVSLPGSTRTPSETAAHYGNADIVVVPSHREVWGFVVNEALACGAYVVASDEVGSAEDLIARAPARVGRTFTSGDPTSLTEVLSLAIEDLKTVDRGNIKSWADQNSVAKYASSVYDALVMPLDD